MHKRLIFMILLASLLPASVYAGWSEDIRLTTRGREFNPRVVACYDTIHVAWATIVGIDYISYMNSHDGGDTWGDLVNLNEEDHLSARLAFSHYASRLLTAWYDIDTTGPGNSVRNIGYSISTDGGSSWPAPSYVFEDGFGGTTNLAADIQGNSIFIAYYAIIADSAGFVPFRFLYSANLGQSWSEEQTLGYGSAYSNGLAIKKCQNTIYAVWSVWASAPIYNMEVFLATSFDWGQTWSGPVQLSSEDDYVSQHVCMTCDENTGYFAVGWMEANYPGDLCLRVTTDRGTTWGDIRQATTHHGVSNPSLAIAGDTIWAVWSDIDPDYGTFNREIAFCKSTDLGITWTPYERLTFVDGMSQTPWLDYDNGKLHLVWWEYRRPPHLGDEIYYKRFTPDPTGIFEDRSSLPVEISIAVYPNPFNSSANITLNQAEGGDVEIEIYDIRGRLIRKLKAYGIQGGDKKAVWDARDNSGKEVSSGVYFARAKTSRNYSTIKLLYLK